jgi:hypothetical protein
MSWLNHPAYSGLLKEASSLLVSGYGDFHYLKPVVFLCGKYQSRRRISVVQKLRRRVPGVHIFFAENVWERVARDENVNALDMENQLAGLSDCVVILVESPGTFAELGAFANDDRLRKKLFPILDKAYEGDKSFINTGPVAWVNATQGGSGCLFTPFEPDFEATDELEARIRSIKRTGRPSTDSFSKDLVKRPKDLLFLVCDLVALIGPAPKDHVEQVFNILFKKKRSLSVSTLLGLALALELICKVEGLDKVEYFYRPIRNGRLEIYQDISGGQVAVMRSKVMNVLRKIPKAQKALDAVAGAVYVA